MMDFIMSLLGSATYSVLGFAVGWLVGREVSTIEQIREAVVNDSPEEEDLPEKVVYSRKLGLFVIALTVFTVLQAIHFSYEQRQATECLAAYNTDLARTQELRAEWADQDRAALLAFLHTYRSDASRMERVVEFQKLIDTYDKNTVRRSETPLPVLDACVEDE